MPTTPYSNTALPAEEPTADIANITAADVENHFNKTLRAIKEIWACINGDDAGTDSNNTALQNYLANGIVDRIENLELYGRIKSSAIIQIGYALATNADRSVRFILSSASAYAELFYDATNTLFKFRNHSGTLLRVKGATPTESDDFATKSYVDAFLVGMVLPYAPSAAPTGWLMCYGQAVSRSTYATLFAAIGTTYGTGDGSTTFNLPDMRGRIPLGVDNMGGSAANRVTSSSTNGANSTTLGGAGGAQTHTLVTGEMPAHTHNMLYTTQSFGSSGFNIGNTEAGSVNSKATSSTGGDGAHSNTQPWLALNYIIKT